MHACSDCHYSETYLSDGEYPYPLRDLPTLQRTDLISSVNVLTSLLAATRIACLPSRHERPRELQRQQVDHREHKR